MVPGLNYVQTLIACALVALLVGLVQQVRVVNARAEIADLHARIATAHAAAETEARRIEHRWRNELDEIEARYEKEKTDAEQAHFRVVADLESGAARLRAYWQGCQATADLSAAATAAWRADELARLREQAAARIVRVGVECDAHVRGLQSVVRAMGKVQDGGEKR